MKGFFGSFELLLNKGNHTMQKTYVKGIIVCAIIILYMLVMLGDSYAADGPEVMLVINPKETEIYAGGENIVITVDAMLNLPPNNVSYTLQKHLVLEVIKNSFQDARETVARWTGVTITQEHVLEIVHDAAQDLSLFS
jgi:hypothetical protein